MLRVCLLVILRTCAGTDEVVLYTTSLCSESFNKRALRRAAIEVRITVVDRLKSVCAKEKRGCRRAAFYLTNESHSLVTCGLASDVLFRNHPLR